MSELLKNGGEVMIDWLGELLQMVWRTRQVSSEWKCATLVPLHKKNINMWDMHWNVDILKETGELPVDLLH